MRVLVLPVGRVREVVSPEGRVVVPVPPSAIGMISVNVPKLPLKFGDTAIDAREVPAASLRFHSPLL